MDTEGMGTQKVEAVLAFVERSPEFTHSHQNRLFIISFRTGRIILSRKVHGLIMSSTWTPKAAGDVLRSEERFARHVKARFESPHLKTLFCYNLFSGLRIVF
ncbi:hypothetical protein AVEN_105188-1 [Araneus ventricosus]|uniref:Uncharacterized protein n=1 Tax=Araneus ventricosus TaxID=182803 RepID=A0A4Y2KGW0_ARAVE|nr:hypothetical protein AVEN_105188-1 [Araneus ventricosus]